MSCQIPYSIYKLPGSDKYKMLALNRLKSKSLLRSCYRNNLRGVRLTADARKTLLLLQPDRYNEILSGNSIVSSPKHDVSSRLRLHRMAEVFYADEPFRRKGVPYEVELRLKILLQQDICYARLPGQYASVRPGAIVVNPAMNQFPPLLRGKAAGKKPFVQGNQFDHFHYLTTDHHGEVLPQILCSPKQRNQLDRTLLCDFAPARAFLTENDGFDEKSNPVLLAYSCDIPRIYRFYSGLVAHCLRGTVFCFDFQEATLREVCGNTVSFEVIDFDIYERSVFHNSR